MCCVFKTMTFRFFACCVLALIGIAAGTADGRAQQPGKAAEKKDVPKAGTRINFPPMMFFVAKGGADECGPGCDTWIAAYGEIDSGATTRFRRFLDRLGKHDMPIYIQSPGGLTLRATTMGELLRARKLKIAVGRTVPLACGDKPYTPECNKARQSSARVEAKLQTNAVCASACVYMMLGGVQREVAWDAALGVHSSKVVLSRNGRQVRNVPKVLIQDAQRREAAMIDSYVKKMGIGMELMTVTRSVPFESIRRLTREEIARFGIDRRDFGDSGWSVRPFAYRTAASVVMFRKGWGGAEDYALIRLALSCLPDGSLDVDYQTQGSDKSNWPEGDLVVRFGEERVRLKRIGNALKGPSDRAAAAMPRDTVERVEKADSIVLLHEGKSGAVVQQTPISKAGYDASIRRIIRDCKSPDGEKKDAVSL